MRVFHKFLSIVAVTIAAGALTFTLVQSGQPPAADSVLFITATVAIVQLVLAFFFARQLESDRKQALEVAARIGKEQFSLAQDGSFSTMMKSLEELFRETLRRERKVVENAADVICLVSTDGIIMSANAASKPVLGYAPEELVGQKLSNFLVIPEHGNDSFNPLLGGNESIHKISLENQFKKKDGSVVDVLWSAHWSATDNGLFCVVHDITERKYAEKLLKESEERVRFILESLPAGVCVLGSAGQIQFINQTARQMCLIDDDKPWNRQARTIFRPCASPFAIERFVGEILESPEPRVLSSAAAEIPIEVSARILNWEDHPACLVLFIDASEKHAAEQAKQQFLIMRDEALALRQKLMDMVVHDIKSPLSSLLSTHELLLRGISGTVEDKVKKKLEMSQSELKRIVRLLTDLLRISRHEATKLDLSLDEEDMAKLIEQAVNSIHDLALEKAINIKINTVGSIVNVDSDRILQVLFNLLSNAVKFSPRNSEIEISSTIDKSTTTSSGSSGFIRTSVTDQGKGIPEGSESSIFLPYMQVSWKDSAERGGTGLGLSICKEIVEGHSGSIGVTNNPDGGAKFWFTIPIPENLDTE